jgi:hypothetical protein
VSGEPAFLAAQCRGKLPGDKRILHDTQPVIYIVIPLLYQQESPHCCGLCLSKKSLGLLRVVTLNPHIPAVPVHPAQYDRPFRAISLCVLPPASPKDERQNVVTPSKNLFFDGLSPHCCGLS